MTTASSWINKSPLSLRSKKVLNKALVSANLPINCTTATLAVKAELHANRTVTLNRAAGIAITLPAATGSGDKYRFVVGTTFTGNCTIDAASSNDKFSGHAILAQDSADTVVHFGTAAGTDKLTMYTAANNTTGGIKGAVAEFEDIATNLWSVFFVSEAGGTEATPFDS